MTKSLDYLRSCDRGWLTIAGVGMLGFLLAFWPLVSDLPAMWLGTGEWALRTGDGYYSHGFLVPLIAFYVAYKNWDRIGAIAVKPGWSGVPMLLVGLWILWAGNAVDLQQVRSGALILVLLGIVWVVWGVRWMIGLAPSILYLIFALPVWTGFIDNYTNPLQIVSTKVSYFILKGIGYNVYQEAPTALALDRFDLNVAVPCSGMKLLVAVTAFTVFFMMVARLRLWANGTMLVLILPLCLFINGLRIALIGVVGENFGRSAGLTFHDYSGYVTLIVCFFILFKVARWLGWKD